MNTYSELYNSCLFVLHYVFTSDLILPSFVVLWDINPTVEICRTLTPLLGHKMAGHLTLHVYMYCTK